MFYPDSGNPTDGTFCSYNNVVGDYLCDIYKYNNYTFTQTDSWSVNMDADGTQTMATDVGRARRFILDNGNSKQIKQYLPTDAEYIDEVDEIETSILPYEFKVHYSKSNSLDDYQLDIKVNKTNNGFVFVIPPIKIK